AFLAEPRSEGLLRCLRRSRIDKTQGSMQGLLLPEVEPDGKASQFRHELPIRDAELSQGQLHRQGLRSCLELPGEPGLPPRPHALLQDAHEWSGKVLCILPWLLRHVRQLRDTPSQDDRPRVGADEQALGQSGGQQVLMELKNATLTALN